MNSKTIGEFAAFCGVGVETVRYYQRQGLLAIPVQEGEYGAKKIRRYHTEDIRRLKFILAAKKAGFTLKEIKKLLELDVKYDRKAVQAISEKRIKMLDEQIAELMQARESLQRLLTECKKSRTHECPILSAFE